jgi:hypothetical protein
MHRKTRATRPAYLTVLLFAAASFLLSLLPTRPAHAQSVDDAGLWTAVFGQGDLPLADCPDHQLKWWFDGQIRFLDDTDGFNQSLIRPGLGLTITERSTLWAGYAWIHTEPVTGTAFEEHRLWQQWTWGEEYDAWKLSLRSRLEERFLETGDDTGLRFRQQVRLERKLTTFPNMSLIGWDEIFYHLNDTDWGAQAGFDQNRAFVGVGFSMDENCRWRTEVGYLHQVIDNATSADRVNHILSVNFFWR